MKYLSRSTALLFAAALLFTAPLAVAGGASEPPRPLTPDGVRAWLAHGGLRGFSKNWPTERALDLNDDGKPELLLAVGGYGRGLTFALFSPTDSRWRVLAEDLEVTPPLFDVLSDVRDGWHDLAALQRTGRGGYMIRVYRWTGSGYSEHPTRIDVDAELPSEFSIHEFH